MMKNRKDKGHRKEGKRMSAEESKATMRRYFGVFEQGNIDLLDELLAPDYVNHTPRLLTYLPARRESKPS